MICALALVLLLDASGSISARDWQLQLDGHAAALESPEVQRIIARDGLAVSAWAFADYAQGLAGWTVLRTPDDARALATRLRTSPRLMSGGTDIGQALRVATGALGVAPCGDSAVIDLVTDGEAAAAPTEAARDEAARRGVVINALAVGSPDAAAWLREHAVTPGGFVVQAAGWGEFAAAMRRKMVLEVAQAVR